MATFDLKLEVVAIPVSDVDRAKRFYDGLGWRLHADFIVGDAFRVIQFTPPGSSCSIHFGKGVTPAAHGEHEKRIGQRDENWQAWYADHMVREQSGKPLPA
jgi:catechol 2,3-dioxygenase-like lactoylglutathione lyase family enzyme